MLTRFRQTWLIWVFAATILVSAFLVFQVQPIISKTILPWFGGSPAVWTTCMLFFQVILFAGYAYAHVLTRLRPLWQAAIHLLLILGALLVLPITPSLSWKPDAADDPTWRILLLLGANVGLPYFLLSSTGPLVQAWFSRAYSGKSPYRLYALSNIGSLAALLTYPFLVEPTMNTSVQGGVWSVGFCVFALLCTCCAARVWGRSSRESSTEKASRSRGNGASDETIPGWGTRFAWLVLPAFASIMLLATTNHVCQDVAVIPFLWVIPLSLYLLSFIICFDSEGWYVRRLFGLGGLLSIGAVSIMMLTGYYPHLVIEIAAYFAALFFVCMLCHGELVRRKPAPEYLTSFYLMCSGGGALGGVLVAIVCPAVFSNFFELNLAMLGGYILAAAVFFIDGSQAVAAARMPRQAITGLVAFAGLLAVVRAQLGAAPVGHLAIARNFYGVMSVGERDADNPHKRGRVLVHGRIVHGFQYDAPEKRHVATKYFAPESGIGVTLRRFPHQDPMRVGVIGLGVGTVATYGQEGDYYRFYEINPVVIDMAREYFTYLSDSPATIDVVLGDGRLSLEAEPSQQFDVLMLDAFSGDAVPTHLLTREAFAIYRRHLKPNGILAANISNRRVDLRGVFTGLADLYQLDTLQFRVDGGGEAGTSSSHWIIGTRNQQFLADAVVRSAALGEGELYVQVPLWTDEYSNLFQILKF